MMVTTQEIVGLPESANGSLRPCSPAPSTSNNTNNNNSASLTSLHQLQHPRSANPRHHNNNNPSQNNKKNHQYSSDCSFQRSGGCSCSDTTCSSETSSICSCSESESDTEFRCCTTSPEGTSSSSHQRQKGFAAIRQEETNSGTGGGLPGRSSFLKKSNKKEQYRIRFQINKEQQDPQVHPLAQTPTSSAREGRRVAGSSSTADLQIIKPGAKSSDDSGVTTSSYSSHCYFSSRASPLIPVQQRQNLSHIPTNVTTISASCSNIFTTNYRKLDGFATPPSLFQSQTLTKPKRAKSFRKLLSKSKSFVFSSNNSNARVDIKNSFHNQFDSEKFKQKSDLNISDQNRSNVSNVSKWLRGFKRDVDFLSNRKSNNAVEVCKSCGGVAQPPDFSPTPKKYTTLQRRREEDRVSGKKHYGSSYEQRSWLEMNSEDIYSYGKYTRLPTAENCIPLIRKQDHPDFLSLRRQNQSKSPSSNTTIITNQGNKPKVIVANAHDNQKDKEHHPQGRFNIEGSSSGRSGGDASKHKLYHNYNKCKEEANGVQQVVESGGSDKNKSVTMANYHTIKQQKSGYVVQKSMEFLDDEYHSFYDCRIPRPKLKFVIPTHSYGVSSTMTMKNLGRKIDIVDASGFTEISLSDNENEADDTAYGSGSGSQSSKSSKFRSENSSEDTLSEFEREQELSLVNGSSRRLVNFNRSLWAKHSTVPPAHRGKSDQMRIVESLKVIPLFRKLSTSFLTKLSEHVNEVSYDCGEYLIRQGSRAEGLFILMSGTAKVTFLSNLNGEEVYLKTLHPGDIFGDLQGERVNMMNVMTTDETATSLVINEDGFSQLMAKSTEFSKRFGDTSRQTFVNEYFERIELEDLRLISTLGIGGFGRVELVTLASDQSQSFALKQMKKCQIVATRQVEHIKSEKRILMETNSEFITKLHKTFKDDKYLYMLMECCLGGELWSILRDRGHFNDTTTRFYVGCVLEALKYLHARNIIYRDLKPENLLLDSKGYLKLVDFGFAKRLETSKTWTFCGTPEYVAPEVILNKGHGIPADYWSLGVLMYELLSGSPPFVGGDPMRTYKLILKGIDFLDFPETITKQSYSLIRKLCRENPEDRLGANRGLSEIKRHKWFDGLDWNGLRSRSLAPPIIPCVKGPHDAGNFDEYPPDRSVTPPDDRSGWDWDF